MYYVRDKVEYGCRIFQVVNSETGAAPYYDKAKEVAERVCNKWNTNARNL